ncbi:hypothetical protein ACV3PA_13135 [Exiguobacterium acetylicum]|uniref:hypothetical protein n=1 Tax=Exiguobacterium sp. BMC-KP TaxID=1684312 RepID=UPI0006AA2C0F|nr:hypothetical protein [Exiguobacterium sp. BMC-KP]KOP28791.1 hypothetical protein ADM98_07585 [Exiguobacterium sp. BMC-KP]
MSYATLYVRLLFLALLIFGGSMLIHYIQTGDIYIGHLIVSVLACVLLIVKRTTSPHKQA